MENASSYVMLKNPKLEILPALLTPPEQFGFFFEVIDEDTKRNSSLLKNISVSDMHMPDFSIRTFKGSFEQDVVFVNENNIGSPAIGHCFCFKGLIKTFLINEDSYVQLSSGHQNFKHDPKNEFRHLIPANEFLHLVHFSITPNYFLQLLPEDEQWSDVLKQKIANNDPILGLRPSKITMAQEIALNNILHCPYEGKLGKLMVESSMIYIIVTQLNNFFQNQSSALPTQKVSTRDRDILYSVKKFLDLHYLDTHSLACLSRKFGINQQKLTSTFKNLFGVSVFEYILDLKMNHAKTLLQEHDMLIGEVSELLGYKNQQHFTVAFKKKHGVIPSKIKTTLNS